MTLGADMAKAGRRVPGRLTPERAHGHALRERGRAGARARARQCGWRRGRAPQPRAAACRRVGRLQRPPRQPSPFSPRLTVAGGRGDGTLGRLLRTLAGDERKMSVSGLKAELKFLASIFDKNHERFRIVSWKLDELHCHFLVPPLSSPRLPPQPLTLHCNITVRRLDKGDPERPGGRPGGAAPSPERGRVRSRGDGSKL